MLVRSWHWLLSIVFSPCTLVSVFPFLGSALGVEFNWFLFCLFMSRISWHKCEIWVIRVWVCDKRPLSRKTFIIWCINILSPSSHLSQMPLQRVFAVATPRTIFTHGSSLSMFNRSWTFNSWVIAPSAIGSMIHHPPLLPSLRSGLDQGKPLPPSQTLMPPTTPPLSSLSASPPLIHCSKWGSKCLNHLQQTAHQPQCLRMYLLQAMKTAVSGML